MAVKKRSGFLILAMTMVLLFVLAVGATSESFSVPAGQEETRVLSLMSGDHVQVRFTVTGGTTNTVGFSITDPDGNLFESFGSVGSVDYSFVCLHGGDYTLHFSNAGSSEDVLVSLDCEVDHYVLGMPQMLFLALVILAICMVALAVFILTSKRP